jgi:hypothetical protein
VRAYRDSSLGTQSSPLVLMVGNASYTPAQVAAATHEVRGVLAAGLGYDPAGVFISVRRVQPRELHVDGETWDGEAP